jgi:hypothetical protein
VPFLSMNRPRSFTAARPPENDSAQSNRSAIAASLVPFTQPHLPWISARARSSTRTPWRAGFATGAASVERPGAAAVLGPGREQAPRTTSTSTSSDLVVTGQGG